MNFGLLGPLLVESGDQRRPTLTTRQRVLLAGLLLRANLVVPMGELAELIWERQQPRDVRGALHNHVMRLRQALGMAVGARLRTQAPGYILDVQPDELDVTRFTAMCARARVSAAGGEWEEAAEQIGEALDLWRGDPLVDVPCDLLHRIHAGRLSELRVQATELRVEADLHLWRHEAVVPELRQLTVDHPLRERFRAQLMLALHRSGRQAEALATYLDARQALVENLGAEPGDELRRVHQMILSGEPDSPPAASVAAAGQAAPGEPASWTGRHADNVAIDRRDELAALRSLAVAVREGRPGVALVRGPAGIGKTALLNTWLDGERGPGLRVVRAACAELEQDFAFAAVRQLFEPVIAGTTDSERDALLDGPASRVLGADVATEERAAPPASTHALLNGLYRLLTRLAESGPLAVVVDDAHWCDPPSLGWFAYLSRRLDHLPVLLVVAARVTVLQPEQAQAAAWEEIAGSDGYRIDVPPLGEAEVTRVVRAVLGAETDSVFSRACHDASGGNPLYLGELLRTLADNDVAPISRHAHRVQDFGARRLSRTVLERLALQDDDTMRVAKALAVLGDAGPLHVAAQLCGLTEFDVVDQVRRLQQLGLLRSGTPTAFRHPLFREAVLRDATTPAELDSAHAEAARVLYDDGASSETVGSHLLRTTRTGGRWPAEALQDAARVARGRGAPEVAAAYLKRALREEVSPALRTQLLTTLGMDEMQHNPARAARHLREALELTDEPTARARLAGLLGTALVLGRQGHESVRVLGAALDELSQAFGPQYGPQRELALTLEAQLIQVAYENMSTINVVRQRVNALDPASLPGDTPGERALLAALSLHGLAGNASARRTAELIDRALRGGLQLIGPSGVLFALATVGLLTTDRLAEAAGWFGEMAEQARRAGAMQLALLAGYGMASVDARRGNLVEALGRARAALDQAPHDVGYSVLPFVALIINIEIDRGDLAAAHGVLAEYQAVDWADAVWDRGPFMLARGRLMLASGDAGAALAALLECGNHLNTAGIVNPALAPWRSHAAYAYAALGQREAALELAREELELARRWGTPRAVGTSLVCLGSVSGGAEGHALLAEAVAVLETSPARSELARALLKLGVAEARVGDPEQAHKILLRAAELVEQCGADAEALFGGALRNLSR